MYNERGKRSNGSYIEEYKNYFLKGGYIPGIEMEKMVFEQLANSITLDQVNQYVKELITDKHNLVIAITGPEKEGIAYPKEEDLSKIYLAAYNQDVEALQEEASNEELLDKALKGGKVISQKEEKKFGTTLFKLDNGITVRILPTDYKDDEIRMRGVTEGGLRLYSNNDTDILLSLIHI